jgi:toxin ParE1/3/4
MEIKILWSDSSLGQLHEIYDYYKIKASARTAKKIVRGIVQKTILLESNPLIGASEPLLAHRPFDYRYVVEGNYKIIYRFSDKMVRIVSVFDCRQNPLKIDNAEA